MKVYQFKIQWLLTFENFKKFMEIIQTNRPDKIIVRDGDLNIIKEFSGNTIGIVDYIKTEYYNKLGDNFYVEVIKK